MIRIVIAEDHQALIDGMKVFIENENDIEIVGQANDGETLLEIVRSKKPDIVLTDIRMPKIDGITATRTIKSLFPEIKVIAFSMFEQQDAIEDMKNAGAIDYIVKNAPMQKVVDAIRNAFENNGNPESAIKIKQHEKFSLSTREKEILKLIGQGMSSQEIADHLFIGKTTVDSHRKNLIKKLNIEGKNDLIRIAVERNYNV
jgi:two-component system, NarL family, response regulator NreC